jgi:hypothetical protein
MCLEAGNKRQDMHCVKIRKDRLILRSFVKSLVNYADLIGKNGVTVLADMGSFFYYNKPDDLIEYEMSFQRTSDIKAKGFCLYNRNDFSWRISRIQRKKLLDHHGRELIIAATSTTK